MALLTLAQAKDHLHIAQDHTSSNTDILLKLDQANAIVLERCNSTAWWRDITVTWDATTVPLAVQAAILVVLADLYERRPIDWAAVDLLIPLNKDPVIA